MEKSLTCVAKSDISGKKLSSTFSTVCGYQGGKFCEGVSGNATTGKYGAYSVCTPEQQLSFAMNQYYEAQAEQGNGQDACDFDGAATSQSTSEPTAACSSLLSQAGSDGTGSVKASPTAASGGSGGSGDSGADTSEGAAFALSPGSVHVGVFQVGAYVTTAIFAGAAMILL